MRTLGAVTAALALSVVTASAQTLSGPSLGNASSPNEATASSSEPLVSALQRDQHPVQRCDLLRDALLRQRLGGLRSCLRQPDGDAQLRTTPWSCDGHRAQPLRLSIATRRTAGLTINDDGSERRPRPRWAPSAVRTSGGTVISGACTLGDPADNASGSSTDVNVNQTNSLNV